MARLSRGVPQFIIDILGSVDYSRITDAHYDEWMRLIRENIGKHLKLRTKASVLLEYNFPIRQDLCDLINRYDFGSLPLMKQVMITPLVKQWSKANLPMKHRLR